MFKKLLLDKPCCSLLNSAQQGGFLCSVCSYPSSTEPAESLQHTNFKSKLLMTPTRHLRDCTFLSSYLLSARNLLPVRNLCFVYFDSQLGVKNEKRRKRTFAGSAELHDLKQDRTVPGTRLSHATRAA